MGVTDVVHAIPMACLKCRNGGAKAGTPRNRTHFVNDHQPVRASFVEARHNYRGRFYPDCGPCSNEQGGLVAKALAKGQIQPH